MRTEEVGSSLSLQALIYFNIFYSVMYAIMGCALLVHRMTVYKVDSFYGLLMPVVFAAWACFEPFRLLSGWFGNLNEKVPSLFVFVVLSAFPQLPCMVFMTFVQRPFFPFDMASGLPMLLFLVIQLILSWLSLRRLIGRRTATFFQLIQQEEPDDMVGGSPRRGGPRSPNSRKQR